jgi:energy-coupling factor transporter ATP-binding protein EcfA2
MVMQFRPATREHAKARIALIGPSGSGKTKSALLIAQGLCSDHGRIAVIDTEAGSASKYAGQGVDFETLELGSFAPTTYIEAIQTAQRAGFEVLIVDSLSHAWMGAGGALEMVDQIAKRSQSKNSFTAWRDVTPEHNRLVAALVGCSMHLIVTMRSKMEYVLEDVDVGGGKTVKQPRKVGLAPVQREGLEYEFDVVGDITLDHDWLISKTRCELFDKAVVHKPGSAFAAQLLGWLNTGSAPKPRLVVAPAAPQAQTQSASKTSVTTSASKSQPPPSAAAAAAASPSSADRTRPPSFSARGEWGGTEEWSGKPLASAPLAVLLEYNQALGEAIASPKNKARIRVLLTHRESVAAAIRAAQVTQAHAAQAQASHPDQASPAADGVSADDTGWDLTGQGGNHDDDP